MGNPLVLIDQLCQSYHWTFEQAMSMTLPQIVMLNHAAHVNSERTKARVAAKTEKTKAKNDKDPIAFRGKRLSQLTEDELTQYYSTF